MTTTVKSRTERDKEVLYRLHNRSAWLRDDACDALRELIFEDHDVADYWSAVGDDREKLINQGKKLALDRVLDILVVFEEACGEYADRMEEALQIRGARKLASEIKEQLQSTIDDLEDI